MLFEGGTQKYTEIRRKEGDAVVLLKEIIQELFQKCKFFIKNWRIGELTLQMKSINSLILQFLITLRNYSASTLFSSFPCFS